MSAEIEQAGGVPIEPHGEAPQAPSTVDALAEVNRVQLTEGTMKIAGKDALTAEESRAIAEAFKAFRKIHPVSLKQAAKETGYSAPSISEFLSGRYRADPTKLAKRLAQWMEQTARRGNIPKPAPYVPTWVAEQIYSAAMHANDLVCMAAIVCPAGTGKTTVLKVVCEENGGIYVSCPGGMHRRDVYRAIAERLGWRRTTGTCGELLGFILSALAGTKRMIVLDEAHQLGRTISCVRAIFDGAHVPIILAGASEILDLIDDRSDGGGQFSSRTMRRNLLDVIQSAGRPDGKGGRCRMLFTQDEVAKFLAGMKIRLSRDGLEMAWRLACLPAHGTLRLIQHLMATLAKTGAESIGRDEILSALDAWVGPGESLQISRMADAIGDDQPATIVAKAG
jgi:DNA transposition AAA+ family ATPase